MTTTSQTRPTWTFTDRLAKARSFAGLSQSAMAARLGISLKTLQRHEAGVPMRPERVIAWAHITGVEVGWLTEGDEEGDADTAAVTHRDTFACAA